MCYNIIIRNCESYNNDRYAGIYLEQGNVNAEISYCECYSNIHGIHIDDATDVVISNNNASGNDVQGIRIVNSNNNTVKNNDIYYNGDDGIAINDNSNGNHIHHNTIRHNQDDGIQLYSL